MAKATRKRCWWCGTDPLYVRYHDKEWGSPVRDDQGHFEHLVLEGFQAGLSWITILRKRDNFRRAFRSFDPKKVSLYRETEIKRLLKDPGIIRHRGKIEAAINNASAFIKIQKEFGTFTKYIWSFTGNRVLRNPKKVTRHNIPAKTALSENISKDLKKRGFKFVGPTTIYAHLQATGLVDDHTSDCYRYKKRHRP